MNEFVNLTNNIGIGNIIQAIITIISLWFGYDGYRKSRKASAPRYSTISSNIINKSTLLTTRTISVTSKDERIDTLTITKLAFWNKGKATLNKESIAEKDPIHINISNGFKFLDYELQYSDKINNITLDLSPNRDIINITFDYFAYNQGFVLKLYHTGLSSSNIILNGSLKTGNYIERIDPFIGKSYRNNKFIKSYKTKEKNLIRNKEAKRKTMRLISIILPLIMILTCLASFVLDKYTSLNMNIEKRKPLFYIFLGLYSFSICGFGLYYTRKPFPRDIAAIFFDDK